MVKYFLYGCLICLCASCGGGGGSAGIGVDPVGTANFLNPVGFTSNVLQYSPRLVAYSKKANRISVIDPVQKREIWGREARGFEFAVKLPNFDGAALFRDNSLVVMTQDSEKTFSIDSNYLQTSIAKTNAAYSLSSIDGTTFELIRSLGDGDWQHQTFTVPWGSVDPAVKKPPNNQPVLLATYFNTSGTMLAALDQHEEVSEEMVCVRQRRATRGRDPSANF